MAKMVKLAYARDSGTGEYMHVSQAAGKAKLICPECGKPVKKKAGPIRRHHFAHGKGVSCSISYETNLHMGAKIFLCDKLKENQEVEILINSDQLPEGALKTVLKKADIPRFYAPLRVLLDNTFCEHDLEKGLGEYVIDVLTTDQHGPKMAWEICVSNPISPEKLEYLNSQKIPFIEMSPDEKGETDCIFEIKQTGNFQTINPDDFTLKSLANDFQGELQTWVASSVLKYFFENAQEILFEKLLDDIDGSVNPIIPGKDSHQMVSDFLETKGSLKAEQSSRK